MKPLKYITILLTSFFLLLTSSCHRYENPVKLQVSNIQPPASNLYKVVPKTLASSIKLPGEFIPFEQVMLYPKVTGFVKNVYVDRGDIVKKGQILLDMEAPEIEQQLIQAKSKLYEDEADMSTKNEKYDRLYATSLTPGTVAPLDLKAAHNDLISARE